MEKVKLPREVAEAIEKLRRNGWKEDDLLNSVEFINDENKPVITADHMGFPVVEFLRKRNFVKYASAIVNGYEIEETPEEKLRVAFEYVLERIKCLGEDDSSSDHFKGTKSGIIIALETLNIKIEGVNA